jgi:hypothetical protein
MLYEDMIIEAYEAELVKTPDKGRIGRFKVRVISSPDGEMKPEEAVPVEYDDKQLQADLARLEGRKLDREGLIGLGRALALLLLPPRKEGQLTGVRELFGASQKRVGLDGRLRLRLRLPPLLAALPWEFMYADRSGMEEGMNGFLALDPRVSIVRHEALPAPPQPVLMSGDIKVVVALASAEGLPPLDLKKEKEDLGKALYGQEGIKPIFLEEATLDELQSAVPGAGVFHFAGHGDFTRQMNQTPGTYTGIGSLALEDQRVGAEKIGMNLRGNGVRLAVLGGCETGRREGVSVWGGIAPALVRAEVPAVVANQFSILDKCAIAFSRQFYRALAGGLPVERAVSAGRIAAYNEDPEGRDWGVPVLYLRAADSRLFAGAGDQEVREQARSAAEAQVNVRAKEVAAGGEVVGAEVLRMLSGKLSVNVTISGKVYGKVVGFAAKQFGGGAAEVDVEVESVEKGATVVGTRLDEL